VNLTAFALLAEIIGRAMEDAILCVESVAASFPPANILFNAGGGSHESKDEISNEEFPIHGPIAKRGWLLGVHFISVREYSGLSPPR
jgi:hypothetical protein